MYRGHPRHADAYPLHLKNYISQFQDAERRRAAMTPNLQINLNGSYNFRTFGAPQLSNGVFWVMHYNNPEDYKPPIAASIFNGDPSGAPTYINDDQPSTTIPQTRVTYPYDDIDSTPTMTNPRGPELESTYDVNGPRSNRASRYQYSYHIPSAQESKPQFAVPNMRNFPDNMEDFQSVYNREAILQGSFPGEIPQPFDIMRNFQEGVTLPSGSMREPRAYTNLVGTNYRGTATSSQYDFTGLEANVPYAESGVGGVQRQMPENPPRTGGPCTTPIITDDDDGIVIHGNGVLSYGDKTVGVIDPNVLRLTNNFIFDSESVPTPPTSTAVSNAEVYTEREQRDRYVSTHAEDSSDNSQNYRTGLVRGRSEDSNGWNWPGLHSHVAKRARLDVGSQDNLYPPLHEDDDEDDGVYKPQRYCASNNTDGTHNWQQYNYINNNNNNRNDVVEYENENGRASASRSINGDNTTAVGPPSIISISSAATTGVVSPPPATMPSPPPAAIPSPPPAVPSSSTPFLDSTSTDAAYTIPGKMQLQFLFDKRRFRRLYILHKLSAIKKVDDDDLGEKCVICLVDFELDQTILCLRCGHKFHDRCIYTWCTTAMTCPICRRGVDDEAICRYFPNRLLQNLEYIRYFLIRRRFCKDGLGAISENDEVDSARPSTSTGSSDSVIQIID